MRHTGPAATAADTATPADPIPDVAARGTRLREVVLWLVVLQAVLNFSWTFLVDRMSAQEPVQLKVVKDLFLMLLLGTAIILVLLRRAQPPPATPRYRLFGWTLLIWAVYVAVHGLFFDASASGYAVTYRYYVLYPAILIAIHRLGLTKKELVRFARGLVVVGVMEGALAIADFLQLTGENPYIGEAAFGDRLWQRAVATLGNPNNLALFLGLPAVILLAALAAERRSGGNLLPRPLAALLLLPVLGGMAVTYSRTAFIALFLTGLVLVTMLGTTRMRALRRALVVIGVAGAIVPPLLAVSVVARAGGDVTSPVSSPQRVESFSAALERWTESPAVFLLGRGLGTSTTVADSSFAAAFVTDNMPLTLADESGLVGLVVFGLLVVAALRLATEHLSSSSSRTTVAALLAYAIFVLFFGLLYEVLRVFPAAFFFWLVIAIAWQLGRVTAERRDDVATNAAT